MKTITSNHTLQRKLWIALLVSVVGLSACSNEVEETRDSTMDTNEATDEMTDGSVTGNTTMVDENNTSFNQDPVESTQ